MEIETQGGGQLREIQTKFSLLSSQLHSKLGSCSSPGPYSNPPKVSLLLAEAEEGY